jgi:hypothetical protein
LTTTTLAKKKKILSIKFFFNRKQKFNLLMVLSAINHDITSKANNPPGVADSRHNPNNKPFEFKTWAQTVKNQK